MAPWFSEREVGLGARKGCEREDATHRSCSASVCNVMSAAVCRYFCTAFTVRVVQSAVFLYNTGLILVRCAPMVDAWVASLGAMHFYATNSRPLQLLARVEEAAGSTLVPSTSQGLVLARRVGGIELAKPEQCSELERELLRACTSRDALAETKAIAERHASNARNNCGPGLRAIAPLR